MKYDADLVIIGAGSSGLSVAAGALLLQNSFLSPVKKTLI